jgi:FkbM family methyltransferase
VTIQHQARLLLRRAGLDVRRFPGVEPWAQTGRLLQHLGVDLVLDVGANDGGYGRELRASGYTGRIVSFEPVSSAFARLSASVAGDDLWEVFNLGLAAESGQAVINVAGNDEASSSLLPMLERHRSAAPEADFVSSETIELTSLDEVWIHVRGSAARPFLKADVQGYEREVLQGASSLVDSALVGVQIETSLVPLYEGGFDLASAQRWLEDHGFSVRQVIPGFTDPVSGEHLQVDLVGVQLSREATQ